MILIKMSILCIKIDGNIIDMLAHWVKAWKPIILLSALGILYIIAVPNHSVVVNILFAALYTIAIIVEFVLCPRLVSSEYVTTVYPMVEKVRAKFGLKRL